MRDLLGSESGTEVGSSKGMSEGNVERKVGGSAGVTYKVSRLYMYVGMIVMGMDEGGGSVIIISSICALLTNMKDFWWDWLKE